MTLGPAPEFAQSHQTRPTAACPYCGGRRIIRKGVRKNKYGDVQLFYCRYCKKKFTPLVNKHKSFFASSAESVGYKIGRK